MLTLLQLLVTVIDMNHARHTMLTTEIDLPLPIKMISKNTMQVQMRLNRRSQDLRGDQAGQAHQHLSNPHLLSRWSRRSISSTLGRKMMIINLLRHLQARSCLLPIHPHRKWLRHPLKRLPRPLTVSLILKIHHRLIETRSQLPLTISMISNPLPTRRTANHFTQHLRLWRSTKHLYRPMPQGTCLPSRMLFQARDFRSHQ